MVELVERTRIERSAVEVWSVLADFGGIAAWAPNVDHSSLTTQVAEGVGATRRVQVGRNVLLERIVDWQSEERLTYVIEGFPPIVSEVSNSWHLVSSGDATTVELVTRIKPGPRPPHQLAARVIGRAMTKASKQMLVGLAAHLSEGDS